MISPTVGRVVLVHGLTRREVMRWGDQPMAGIVAYVHNDRMVNVTVFDHSGASHAVTSVPLLQDDDTSNGGVYAEWLPYQKGQAAKTEALEAQVAKPHVRVVQP